MVHVSSSVVYSIRAMCTDSWFLICLYLHVACNFLLLQFNLHTNELNLNYLCMQILIGLADCVQYWCTIWLHRVTCHSSWPANGRLHMKWFAQTGMHACGYNSGFFIPNNCVYLVMALGAAYWKIINNLRITTCGSVLHAFDFWCCILKGVNN